MSSTEVAVDEFPLLGIFTANNYVFGSLQLKAGSPKPQEVFFIMDSSQFSKPGFPITTILMSFLKVSN